MPLERIDQSIVAATCPAGFDFFPAGSGSARMTRTQCHEQFPTSGQITLIDSTEPSERRIKQMIHADLP